MPARLYQTPSGKYSIELIRSGGKQKQVLWYGLSKYIRQLGGISKINQSIRLCNSESEVSVVLRILQSEALQKVQMITLDN